MVKVNYNRNEKVLGVLGLSPYATIDFLKKLADETPAKKDWEHLRVILDLNTKIPSRGRALELNEESPVQYIREAILKLKKSGVSLIVIPCNTAHYFYEEIVKNLGVSVLNMIEENSNYIINNFVKIKNIGLMSSRTTRKYKLYGKYLHPAGINILDIPDTQSAISDIIESVKIGNDGNETKAKAKEIAEKLINNGAEAIILGCTEIPLLLNEGDFSVPIFDTNKILAKSCIKIIKDINDDNFK